jgi:hypothetical protein
LIFAIATLFSHIDIDIDCHAAMPLFAADIFELMPDFR